MKTLAKGRRNSKTVVRTWQEFLRGLRLLMGEADGIFGNQTHRATIAYQRIAGMVADGIVGNKTWGQAMADGLDMVEDKDKSKTGPNWPPRPAGARSASLAVRQKLFGTFRYKHSPHPANPEAIKILGNWTGENIAKVTIPQLKGVRGAPKSGVIYVHKRIKAQVVALFQAWEYAGLVDLVEAWAGSWVPRFIRGSRTSLSNHAWGTAFDINAPWNGLRRTPALVGSTGSVRELVGLAHALGFYWGGWFSRKDGMHFEASKVLDSDEIKAVMDTVRPKSRKTCLRCGGSGYEPSRGPHVCRK
jgi:hypothetical protein